MINKKGNAKVFFLIAVILLLTITVIGWMYYKTFKKPENPEIIKNNIELKADSPSITFSTKAKMLNVYSLVSNDYKPEEIVSVTLRGEIYEPAKNLQASTRSDLKFDTPLDSIAAFFSANKSGDIDRIGSVWVPEERQALRDRYNEISSLESYKGKTMGQINKEVFDKYASISVSKIAYYKDYAFVIAAYQPQGKLQIVLVFKKAADGWLATNYFANNSINQIKAGNKDLTYNIIESSTTFPEGIYTLWQTTDGKVLRIYSGKKDEKIDILQNPAFEKLDGVTIPSEPKNPVWVDAADGTYKTILETSYVIQDSKIQKVLDKNGNDITN